MSDKEIKKLFNITTASPPKTTTRFRTANNTSTNTTSKARKKTNLKPTTCHCSNCFDTNHTCISYNGCYTNKDYYLKTGFEYSSYGCLPGGPHEYDYWKISLYCGIPHAPRIRIPGKSLIYTIGPGTPSYTKCVTARCCYGDYCNNVYPDVYKECQIPRPTLPPPDETVNIAISIVAPIAGALFLLFTFCSAFKWWKRKTTTSTNRNKEECNMTTLTAVPLSDDSLRLLNVDKSCMSSGSGLPFLVQSTVANQIIFKDLIGKGRYGEVWRGTWQNDSVAVKVFNSRDEESWKRETNIFNTVLLRHDNILGYIGSDIASRNGVTCMLLITHYHSYGALYDYINQHTLDLRQMLIFAHSAVNGLAHLHSEIDGSTGKPAIAHRDIKTKNILVKRNGECCISDLGLAVLYQKTDTTEGMVDINSLNYRVGTKRYMAPEVLDETISKDDFQAFTQADMYSFGLVMWEIIRRTHLNGIVEDYQPPYYDVLPCDPPFEFVKKVVKDDQYRPPIAKHWLQNELTAKYVFVMKECWRDLPDCRLASLRVKKTLADLLTQFMVNSDPVTFDCGEGKPTTINLNFCDSTSFTYKSNNTASGCTLSTTLPESITISVAGERDQLISSDVQL